MSTIRDLKPRFPGGKFAKVGSNTYMVTGFPQGRTRVILHETEVYSQTIDGWEYLDSGGWRTRTTKKVINQFGRNFQVHQKKGVWIISTLQGDFPYFDDAQVSPKGFVYAHRSPFPKEAIQWPSKRGAK